MEKSAPAIGRSGFCRPASAEPASTFHLTHNHQGFHRAAGFTVKSENLQANTDRMRFDLGKLDVGTADRTGILGFQGEHISGSHLFSLPTRQWLGKMMTALECIFLLSRKRPSV
jgi:hypothetical protein